MKKFIPPERDIKLKILDFLFDKLLTPLFGERCEICDERSKQFSKIEGMLCSHPCCLNCKSIIKPSPASKWRSPTIQTIQNLSCVTSPERKGQ